MLGVSAWHVYSFIHFLFITRTDICQTLWLGISSFQRKFCPRKFAWFWAWLSRSKPLSIRLTMNTIEGKFDKILRRLSSKSRRAARRINRPTEDSSSGSDQDDLNTQQTGNPKIDRKNGISRRVHQKLFVTSTTSPTTEVEINTHPFSVSTHHFKTSELMEFKC